MTDELDLSGEQDPTERMEELQERSIPEDRESIREPGHDGEMETEEFNVSEALENIEK